MEKGEWKKRGGTTSCVPLCHSNSVKTPNLSFYKFPVKSSLRETWMNLLGIIKHPLNSHKVCSLHFPGDKKLYGALTTAFTPSSRCTKNSTEHLSCANSKNTIVSPQDEPETSASSGRQSVESLYSDLTTKYSVLEEKYNDLSSNYKQCVLRLEHVIASDANFKFYTSFQNYATFKAFFDYLQPACNSLMYVGSNNTELSSEAQSKHGRTRSLSPEQELFMVLVRLRCGLLEVDNANRFGLSQSQVSRIWTTWLSFLYHRLRALPIWPSHEYIQQTMPSCFKENYPKTRVIIDCTEIYIEMPTSFRSQSATFSTYKHHNTAKGLIGISPAGYPTFVSELYVGWSSDKQVTKDCGILALLEPGDDVMADRGFDIEEDMPHGVGLHIPPFLNGASQLSLSDENETRKIAAVRVHVERAIMRIKCFRIIKNVFSLNMSSELNKIWIICSYLTLFSPPLIDE